MLTAVVVTVIAIVVLAVAALVFFRIRENRASSRVSKKMSVNAIDSVGVAAHAPKTTIGARPGGPVGDSGGALPLKALRGRFAAIGAIMAAIFGAIVVKLFSLQVINAAEYSDEAEENQYTTVSTPAPRGLVCDRDGTPLIANRQVQTILADADVAKQPDVLLRLSALLGIPYEVVKARVLDSTSGAQSQRVVASDVELRMVAFISEHKDAFPGVTTQIRTTRTYPYGTLGAHFLGYTGTASEEDLESVEDGRTIESGDAVGKSGIEQAYDSILAGDHGTRTLITDASGEVQQVVSEMDPVKGSDVYLTICAPIQSLADQSLAELVSGGTGTAAALVLLDVQTGDVLAMSNYPTFEPEAFIGGISQDIWDEYQTEESHYPLMNRAIAGTYPAASCFKAFTGLAGLTYGFASSTSTWQCLGTWTGFGSEYAQKCWQTSGHGTLDLREGVIQSCDVVFYEIAKSFYSARESIGNDAMQDFVKEFGYDDYTGIDISGEAKGRIPTPEWKSEYFRDAPEEAQWLPGDISNMSIGQGYVLVTPLQVARAYGGVATGKIMQPHLLSEVRNSLGETVFSFQDTESNTPEVDSANYEIMRDALHGVTLENSSVSKVWAGLDFTAAAKTGTAEVAGKNDYAWFSCYAPYEEPRYALSMIVEEGGSGGSMASIAANVMEAAIQYSNGTLDLAVERQGM